LVEKTFEEVPFAMGGDCSLWTSDVIFSSERSAVSSSTVPGLLLAMNTKGMEEFRV
jgi:hypothetical protein